MKKPIEWDTRALLVAHFERGELMLSVMVDPSTRTVLALEAPKKIKGQTRTDHAERLLNQHAHRLVSDGTTLTHLSQAIRIAEEYGAEWERGFSAEPCACDDIQVRSAEDMREERLRALESLTSSPNWNDERDQPIPSSEWERARSFLKTLEQVKAPYPAVSPCGDGSIHFAWRTPAGGRLVIEQWRDRIVGTVAAGVAAGGAEERRDMSELEALDLVQRTLGVSDA